MFIRGILFLVISAWCAEAADPFSLIGTVINTTTPDKPMAAPIQMVFGSDGKCTLTISPPLVGSGSCAIDVFDEKSGKIEITSTGSVKIVWTGSIKGNLASGTYRVEPGTQSGTFYLAIVAPDVTPQKPPAPPVVQPATRPNMGCVPAIESAISGEVHGWDGETIFKLDNGQIWQQAEYDYTYFYEYHPDVTIYQARGGCRMKVEDEDDTIIVKRIK
jgi:hypothetical protein